jgi:heme-degrading monooxygenase HmoA
MWVRVTSVEGGAAEQFDEAMKVMQEQVLPAARRLAGWKGVLSLSSSDRTKGLTLTFWENEKALIASEEAASRLRSQAASAGGDTVAGVERYEVIFNETPTGT